MIVSHPMSTSDRLPPLPSTAHRHLCGCGDYLVCHDDEDKCLVSDSWMCPRCEAIELDAYYQRMLAEQHGAPRV